MIDLNEAETIGTVTLVHYQGDDGDNYYPEKMVALANVPSDLAPILGRILGHLECAIGEQRDANGRLSPSDDLIAVFRRLGHWTGRSRRGTAPRKQLRGRVTTIARLSPGRLPFTDRSGHLES